MSHKYTSPQYDIFFLMMVDFFSFNPISAVKEAFLCGQLGTSDPDRSILFQLFNVRERVLCFYLKYVSFYKLSYV